MAGTMTQEDRIKRMDRILTGIEAGKSVIDACKGNQSHAVWYSKNKHDKGLMADVAALYEEDEASDGSEEDEIHEVVRELEDITDSLQTQCQELLKDAPATILWRAFNVLNDR